MQRRMLRIFPKSSPLILIFACPLLYLAWAASHAHFIGDINARILAEALILIQHKPFDTIGFVYPNLLVLLAALAPSPLGLSVMGALAGGVTVWMIWRHLYRGTLSTLSRVLFTITFLFTIPILYLFTQSLPDALALMLFAFAWRAFLRFFLGRITWAGFASGLILGLTLFFNLNAIVWGVAFSAGVFGLIQFSHRLPQSKHPGASYGMAMIIAFPVLYIFFSWLYLSWIRFGDIWAFLGNSILPVQGYLKAPGEPVFTMKEAAFITLGEMFYQPLVLAIFSVLIASNALWLAALAIAFSSITLFRGLGLVLYTEPLAIAVFAILALMAIPPRLSRPWRFFLTAAAMVQLVLTPTFTIPSADVQAWHTAILTLTPRPQDILEEQVARAMARAHPASILADHRTIYRYIARAGTSRPFLLPEDANFKEAMVYPPAFVSYILIAENPPPQDAISASYLRTPPRGFVLSAHWPGWRLYRRIDAPDLFPPDLGLNLSTSK